MFFCASDGTLHLFLSSLFSVFSLYLTVLYSIHLFSFRHSINRGARLQRLRLRVLSTRYQELSSFLKRLSYPAHHLQIYSRVFVQSRLSDIAR